MLHDTYDLEAMMEVIVYPINGVGRCLTKEEAGRIVTITYEKVYPFSDPV